MRTHSTRRAQIVSPFGVGALVEIGSESFTMLDISNWDRHATTPVLGSDLSRRLRAEIRSPSTSKGAPGVPVFRFPRWLFCPGCRLMLHYAPALDEQNSFAVPRCSQCDLDFTPMGFVAACEHGHMQDVDWHRWAHKNVQAAAHGQCSSQTATLRFLSSGTSGGDWNALSIKCGCGEEEDLQGLVGPPLPKALMSCRGCQPWQRKWGQCGQALRVFRRGAGNLYFARVVSALDLLPSGDAPKLDDMVGVIRQQSWFPMTQAFAGLVKGLRVDEHRVMLQPHAEELAQRNGWRVEDAMNAIVHACTETETANGDVTSTAAVIQDEIMAAEWPMLSRTTPACSGHIDVRPMSVPSDWPASLRRTIAGIVLVRRLREVRALIGFRRVSPDTDVPLVPVDLRGGTGWLPGVEVSGEGIFVRLDEQAVMEWEQEVTPTIAPRLEDLRAACVRRGWNASVYATPRFILLHTLAHVLMRRLAFDAGYSAASLRERIYASTGVAPMAGVLIYTADSDSEGSLGGLVRMGEPGRLRETIVNALWDASWCSADPVCRETLRQGVGGTNSAACHACALVSETSCVHSNSLLDRSLLLRGPSFPLGFFEVSS